MPDVTIGSSRLRGYLAVPDGDGPWPGVVVLQEVFGLNDDIRAHADRLAAVGYLAVAPDLYSEGPRLRCIQRAMRDLFARRGLTWEYIEQTHQWLTGREDCTGRAGVIGFCLGGGFALLAAARYDFDAAAVNYAPVPPDAAEILRGACPIVASFGKRDQMLRGAAAKLDSTLTTLDIAHDIKEYPKAGHSFLNDHRAPLPLNLLFKVVLGAGFKEAPAHDAWTRIIMFFGEHLTA
jgi:carboxymethylenebutenolidase